MRSQPRRGIATVATLNVWSCTVSVSQAVRSATVCAAALTAKTTKIMKNYATSVLSTRSGSQASIPQNHSEDAPAENLSASKSIASAFKRVSFATKTVSVSTAKTTSPWTTVTSWSSLKGLPALPPTSSALCVILYSCRSHHPQPKRRADPIHSELGKRLKSGRQADGGGHKLYGESG